MMFLVLFFFPLSHVQFISEPYLLTSGSPMYFRPLSTHVREFDLFEPLSTHVRESNLF